MTDASGVPGFYGRDEELAWLYGLFEDAKRSCAPNFAVVVGDSGLGKSRLVQALYQKLAASPEWDPDDFWPDAFGNDEVRSLRVNPDFGGGHEAKGPPKFLWLGVRWEDPEGGNRVDADCPLPNARNGLGRCLEVIVKQHGAWGQGKEFLRRLVPFATGELSDMGFDGVANLLGVITGAVVPGGGLAIKGALAVGESVKGVRGQQSTMEGAEEKDREDAGDQLLKCLRGLMRGGEPMPTVLWLDDAQWVDGATVSFLRKLLLEAKPEGPRKGWPLLVVATHWEREWNEARAAEDSAGKGLAVFEHRSLGGGRSAQVRPLDKSGEGPLGALLDARLPGLTGDQRKLLLGKAAGNFLTMTENIGFLESRKRFFEHEDPRGRLTDAGVRKVKEWKSKREERVEQRFEELREEFGKGHQEVLSWGAGSPLGSRFAEEIVVRVAEAEGVDHPRDVLAECAVPLAVLDGGGAGSPPPLLRGFRDRAWFRYAKQFFDEELKDGSEALDGAVREVFSAWVDACFGADGEPADGYGESPLGSREATERADVLKAAREALPFDADGDWSDGKSAAGLRAACLLVHECARAGLWDRCRRAGEALEGIGWGSVPAKVLGQGFRAGLPKALRDAGGLKAAHGLLLHVVEFSRALAGEAGRPENRGRLADSLNNLGLVQVDEGDLAGAAESLREALGIRRRLAEESGRPEDRGRLAASLNHLGFVQEGRGDLAGAAESHREALGIRRRLAEESGRPEDRAGLAQSLNNLGFVLHGKGDLAGAAESHREALGIRRRLADESGRPEDRADLAASLNHLGLVQGDEGDLAGAAESHREALGIRRRLAEELGRPEDRAGLAQSLNNLGFVLHGKGDLAGAAESHREALGIRRRLADESGRPEDRAALALSLSNLGFVLVLHGKGDLDGAAESLREALGIRQTLADESGAPEHSQAVTQLKAALEELKKLREGG